MENMKTDEKKHFEFTCIVCPVGCSLICDVTKDGGIKVTGNSCPRGEHFAVSELTEPRRTLTSTVALRDSSLVRLPVRSDLPIKKENLTQGMKIINSLSVCAPVRSGDVIVENFTEDGINLIACRSV